MSLFVYASRRSDRCHDACEDELLISSLTDFHDDEEVINYFLLPTSSENTFVCIANRMVFTALAELTGGSASYIQADLSAVSSLLNSSLNFLGTFPSCRQFSTALRFLLEGLGLP